VRAVTKTPPGPGRGGLVRLFKLFLFMLLAGVAYVLLDFAIDLRPAAVQSSYRFEVPDLAPDEVRILRRDNFAIVLARRSAATVEALRQASAGLQDPRSENSRQPEYARNALRSRDPGYFVAYAYGTDLGCELSISPPGLRESCGSARYDLAGRALAGTKRFSNLPIPDYNFDADFKRLTVNP
jgi:ubiquinol-cytochrome c reductase iron-sulfur subunit